MPDVPSPELPPEPDDLVGQVVERAAIKVAANTPAAISLKVERWIYLGVLGVLALCVLAIANLILNVQTKNSIEGVETKVEESCKLSALSQGAQDAPSANLRLAECLR